MNCGAVGSNETQELRADVYRFMHTGRNAEIVGDRLSRGHEIFTRTCTYVSQATVFSLRKFHRGGKYR